MLDAGLVLTLALLAGRVAGLLRELALAAVFGVSEQADAAVLLLTVPDLFVNLLVSGGLSAALVPRLATLAAQPAKALFRQASLAALGLFGALGLVLALWPHGIFRLLAPGLSMPLAAGAAGVIALALAVPLTGLAGVAGAYLNAQQRYFVTGCGTLLFNLGVLAALGLAVRAADPLTLLAAGIAGGAALRWLAQVCVIPGDAWRATSPARLADQALLRAFGSATVAAGLLLLAPLLVRALASLLGTGAIASFNYAQKLVELPVGILITSISTVALTRLAALHGARREVEATQAAVRDTQHALLLALAVMVLGIWFADSVVQVLFSHGQMDAAALARVTALTRVAMLGVPLVALSSMAAARLNASGQTTKILAPTLGALAALPLLAAPGLYLGQELLLMCAVVAFQALVAFWLAAVARLPLLGAGAVADRLAGRFLLAVLGAGLLAVAIDTLAALHNHWLRLALAGVGFLLAMIAVRLFKRATPLPHLVPAP